ncbi:XRE family transcriptional regulator [Desulfosporosinus sp. Tol-M]|nr:XRE family transcriptional regulator [Desulfosporosinus sp. Tol-M]
MKTISIDIETYSSVDLSKSGVYKYAEAPDFEIILFGYSVDGGEVLVADLASGATIPPDIIDALTDDTVEKWAFNAAFERICLSRWLGLPMGQYLNPASWHCSMVWSAYMGLPLSLENVGLVLGLEKQKLTEGKDLIRYFCKPCAVTTSNGRRTRNLPEHAPDKWEQFKLYNRRDVETEMSIQARLAKFPVPDNIWEEYRQDQEINDRGVLLDMTLVKNAIAADERSKSELMHKIRQLTELDNPNSVAQMKNWLAENGLETDTLGKKAVAELLKTAPEPLGEVLLLRQQLAKSSIKKYQAMETVACADNRARGLFQYYGANRTGRAAGRLIQCQNLPQNHMADLEQARSLVRSSDFDTLNILYDNVPVVLSELIRTAFIPKEGCKFIVADFSSIEAVVLAWLAGESWTLEAYSAKRDLYIENAEIMFGVPKGSIDKKSPLRQKSKIAVLACGYSGSVGALKAFGALEMGLKEEELKPLVDAWRAANPNVVRFWWDADKAAKTAVKQRKITETHGIRFSYQSDMLFITLPNGRKLAYVKPRIGENRFGSECVTYEGIGATKKWERIDSSPGKWVENITQAVARDILYYALSTFRSANVVMHVHDEVVIEANKHLSPAVVSEQMSRAPSWAAGLPLRCDSYETPFYRKD